MAAHREREPPSGVPFVAHLRGRPITRWTPKITEAWWSPFWQPLSHQQSLAASQLFLSRRRKSWALFMALILQTGRPAQVGWLNGVVCFVWMHRSPASIFIYNTPAANEVLVFITRMTFLSHLHSFSQLLPSISPDIPQIIPQALSGYWASKSTRINVCKPINVMFCSMKKDFCLLQFYDEGQFDPNWIQYSPYENSKLLRVIFYTVFFYKVFLKH